MARNLFFYLFVLFAFNANAQTITGTVFHDGNNNRVLDRKEKGIAGVGVSNGKEVVLTDSRGRYSLQVDDDDIIFIIKPSDWRLPVNENYLPQFYYNHKPGGSPSGTRYAGVNPTGKLPKTVNFALYPEKMEENFTALFFGDPQPYTQQEVDYFHKGIVNELKGVQNVKFGLSLGDLVGDDLNLHQPYIKAVKDLGIPWFNVMGNHDMNYEASADSLSDETFEKNFGPANYSFNYGKVHFIVLDNILYPDPRDGKGYWSGFRKEQLDFVESDLKHVPKDNLVVLSFHIPLFMYADSVVRKADRDRLFGLLKDFPNTLSVSAHTHLQRHNFYGPADGWLQEQPHHEYNAGTTSGDWYSGALNEQGVPASTMRDGTPKGYVFFNFTGSKYNIHYQVAGKPKDYQMDIYMPEVIAPSGFGSAAIFVNLFNGYKSNLLKYRIDNGEWRNMNWVESPDPTYVANLVNWDKSSVLMGARRPSVPETSTHLWMAGFPSNLSLGEHLVEIIATDLFGNEHRSSKKFSVQEFK